MIKMVIDPKTNKLAEDRLGPSGFISFRRLEELFRESGEIVQSEEILRFVIEESGITYRVTNK